jgi:hypothetical protein
MLCQDWPLAGDRLAGGQPLDKAELEALALLDVRDDAFENA